MNEEDENEDPKLVLLDLRQGPERPPAPVFELIRHECRHIWEVEVDARERIITCKRCKERLDPFDVVLMLSSYEARLWGNLSFVRNACVRAHEELEDLKRQIRNAKARIRRISTREPDK